jgi:hypothetical protein
MSKPIKVVFVKSDTYLDTSYYSVKIKYWDGELVIKENQSSFKFGDVLLPVLKQIDSMNELTSISIHIENNQETKLKMKHLTGQATLNQSKSKTRQELTSSEKEATWLKGFMNHHSIEVN